MKGVSLLVLAFLCTCWAGNDTTQSCPQLAARVDVLERELSALKQRFEMSLSPRATNMPDASTTDATGSGTSSSLNVSESTELTSELKRSGDATRHLLATGSVSLALLHDNAELTFGSSNDGRIFRRAIGQIGVTSDLYVDGSLITGTLSATGQISGGAVSTAGQVLGGSVKATGQLSGGTLSVSGAATVGATTLASATVTGAASIGGATTIGGDTTISGVTRVNNYLFGAARTSSGGAQRLCTGVSPVNGWQWHDAMSVYVDVSLSGCGFTGIPLIFTSVAGSSHHWKVIGTSNIYGPSANSFRVYAYFDDGGALTTSFMTTYTVKINWVAFGA